MARLEKLPLDSDEVRTEIEYLRLTAQSCYGPKGRILAVQPVLLGHTSLTSSSQRLLSLWKPKNRAVQLLVTSLQDFSTHQQEAGLFATLLSTNLIMKGLDLGVPRGKVAAVVGSTLQHLAEYLRCSDCSCRLELPMSTMWFMALVRSMMSTRPITGLDKASQDHLASLLLQAFLHIVPVPGQTCGFSSKQQFHLHPIVGSHVSGFSLVKGLLIEQQDGFWDHDSFPNQPAFRRNENGRIITALFDISMAGDPSDGYPDGLHLESDAPMGLVNVEDVVVRRILEMAQSLVHQGVGFIGCQRCIHRRVKEYLVAQGVVVVDRLSSVYIGAVTVVTGGKVISSFSVGYPSNWLGALTNITPMVIKDRRFLVLEGSSPHATVVLHCNSEVAADELGPLCRGVVSILELSIYHPHVVYGGGCMETALSAYLDKMKDEVTPDMLVQLQCNKRTYDLVVNMIATSFDAIARSLSGGGLCVTDLCQHHCWEFPSDEEMGGMTWNQLSGMLAAKTCRCGAVALAELPRGCKWRCLQPGEIIPDLLTEGLGVSMRPKAGSHQVAVVDLCFIKMKAMELSGDLASSLLRIAYVLRAGT